MARRTISVGPKTWEALSALGKFGQSFDDVIQILLQEHDELKKLKSQLASQPQQPQSPEDYVTEAMMEGIEHFQPRQQLKAKQQYQPRSQPQPQQPQQSKQQQQQQDNEITKRTEGQYTLQLPGIKFPANKNEIIEYAKKAQFPVKLPADVRYKVDEKKIKKDAEKTGFREKMIEEETNLIKQLPDKTYTNKSELEKDYMNVFKSQICSGQTIDEIYKGRVMVVVDDREITGLEQPQQSQPPRQADKMSGSQIYYQRQQDEKPSKLTDDEWLQLQKKFSALEKFIRKIAEELGITKLEATIIIRDRKDLLKRAADEMGTDDEAHVLGILTRQIELFENEPFEKDQQQEQRVPTAVKREYSEKILRPGESVEEEEEVTTEREKTK